MCGRSSPRATTIPSAPDPRSPVSSGARPSPGPAEGAGREAARLEARLARARDRLHAIVPPQPSVDGSVRSGVARIDDDDELRELLRPAASRVAHLVDLAGSLADGRLSDESAAEAARAIAGTQPHRRPR